MSRPDSRFPPAAGTRYNPAQVTPTRPVGKLVRTGNSTVRALRRAAFEQGKLEYTHHELREDGRLIALPAAIDMSGDCMFPVAVGLHGRVPTNPVWDFPGDPEYRLERKAEYQDMKVRCRRCDKCMEHRRSMWAARAMVELAAAERNWFGTLTLSPASQDRFLWQAQQRFRLSGGDPRIRHFADLPHERQFQWRVKVIGGEITKYLKRLRKESGARFRYLLVTEAHKSGLPHFHMLLHENNGSVRKRTLDGQWGSLGFTNWRLVDGSPKVAFYVSKYLSKSALTRIRGSTGYGRITDDGGEHPHDISKGNGESTRVCDAKGEEKENSKELFFSSIRKWGWGPIS